MLRIRRISLALVVWATVVSTVMAGLPHAFCVCPRTPNVTTSTDQEEGPSCCCSAGKAKAKNDKTPNKRKSCCGQPEQPQAESVESGQRPAKTNSDGLQLGSGGCLKQLVHLQLTSVNEKKSGEAAASILELLAPIAAFAIGDSPIMEVEHRAASAAFLSDDLLTLHQRLTI